MLWLHLVVGDHGTTRVIYYVTCVQWNCDLAAFKMIDSKMGTRSATTYTELPNWKWLNKSAVSLDWMGPKIGNYLQSAFINLMSVSCKPSPICLRASVISLGCIMIVWRQVGSHQVTYAITLHLQVVTKKVRLGVFGHIWSANMKKVNVITGHQQITRRDWIDEKKKDHLMLLHYTWHSSSPSYVSMRCPAEVPFTLDLSDSIYTGQKESWPQTCPCAVLQLT